MESLVEGRIVHYVDGEGYHRPGLVVHVYRVLPETRRVEKALEEEKEAIEHLRRVEGHDLNPTKGPPGTAAELGTRPPGPQTPPATVEGTVTSTAPGDEVPTTRRAQVPSPATINTPPLSEAEKEDMVDLIVFHGVAVNRPGGDGDHVFVQRVPRDNHAAKSIHNTWHFIES